MRSGDRPPPSLSAERARVAGGLGGVSGGRTVLRSLTQAAHSPPTRRGVYATGSRRQRAALRSRPSPFPAGTSASSPNDSARPQRHSPPIRPDADTAPDAGLAQTAAELPPTTRRSPPPSGSDSG